jgi:hypothetical protein
MIIFSKHIINNMLDQNVNWPKILGQAIFYASIQAAIGSVEMSSRFSVMNFSKDQETLQNAADALRSYIYIAFTWALATILVMYSQFGISGAIAGLIANIMYVGWIYFSYLRAFNVAANKYGLNPPKVF